MAYAEAPLKLSAEDDYGSGVLLTSNTAPGNLIHQSPGDNLLIIDYLALTAANPGTADVMVTILWGNSDGGDKMNKVLIPFCEGEKILTLPKAIRAGGAVYAYASIGSIITVFAVGGTVRVTELLD